MYVRAYRIIRDHETHLETSIIGIQFVISQQYLLNNKLKVNKIQNNFSKKKVVSLDYESGTNLFFFVLFKIRCTAQVHNVYSQRTEKVIEFDHHKKVHASNNIFNSVHRVVPLDLYTNHANEIHDKKDFNPTYVEGKINVSKNCIEIYIFKCVCISHEFLIRFLDQIKSRC